MGDLPTSAKELEAGVKVGFLLLLRRVKSNPSHSPMRRRRWRVKCVAPDCGNELTVPQSYLVRRPEPKTHCGCQNKTEKTIYNREYRIWIMMNVRCTNPTHKAYKDYGGRGIKLHPTWAKKPNNTDGFLKFLEHIGPAPSKKHTVDRIDVDGNYEPGNVRWATPKEQAQNTRKKVAERNAKRN